MIQLTIYINFIIIIYSFQLTVKHNDIGYTLTHSFWRPSGGISGAFPPQLNPPGRNSGGGTWSSSGAGSRRCFLLRRINKYHDLIRIYDTTWM